MTNQSIQDSSSFDSILRQYQRGWVRQVGRSLIILAIIIASFFVVELLNLERMTDGIPAIINLMGEMFPPDFSRFPKWLEPIFDTLAMSVAGTAIAIGLSIPLALMAARNTTPHPILFHLSRTILNVTRAIPELILGMILVAAVGFGKLPGTLALGLHSVGMVGKFFAESIELSDPDPVEAARSVGATEPQVIIHSILPQVFPQMADVTFYRWEYNFRAFYGVGGRWCGGHRVGNY